MEAANIITLTLNPAVDIATTVERLEPSLKLRCTPARRDAGGGGVNVARAVRRLGGNPISVFPAGGSTGQVLIDLVEAEGVDCRMVPIAGETREDFAVSERASSEQYRFVLPGPALSVAEAQRCLDRMAEQIVLPAIVVASGSLPPGLPDDYYARVARVAVERGALFMLDCAGAALKSALGDNVFLIKPSRHELSEIAGTSLPDRAACLSASRRIVADGGARFVALSLGEEGALFVGSGLALSATAPPVTPLNTVGAGDSFLGAMVFALARALPAEEALRLAVAAGTAALLSPGTGLCDAMQVEAMKSQVLVTKL